MKARTSDAGLWLRWALRDARRRIVLVTVLALIIAIGTGAYASLSSTGTWRRLSNDASYGALDAHDIKVQLRDGAVVPAGRLRTALMGIQDPQSINAVEERLVVGVQLEVTKGDAVLRVPGRIVGMPISTAVDRLSVTEGRGLTPSGTRGRAGVLEAKFAAFHRLPSTGSLRLSGGDTIDYAGTGVTPEYFTVYGSGDAYANQSTFAVVFVPLATAQELAGLSGSVNDLVVRAAPDVALDPLRREIENALAKALPTTLADVTLLTEERSYRVLYDDIETDRQWWNVFAGLVLVGAAIATFNLTSRIVEAQRREIGIGMALGVRRWRLARRPLLVGLQVAILGAIFGIGVGLLIGAAMRGFLRTALPLPIWRTPFQAANYARAAMLGVALPIIASVFPVWRAVRTTPTDALRSGALASGRRGRYLGLVRGLRLPGSVTAVLPVRSVIRTPRRTVLTALGIGASIATLVAILGMLDTFLFTIDRGTHSMTGPGVDRGYTVSLRSPVLTGGPEIAAVHAIEGVDRIEPALAVPATIAHDGKSFDLLLETVDLDDGLWRPLLDVRSATPEQSAAVERSSPPGIALSHVAARDLHVGVGDEVILDHPERTGLGYTMARTPVVVDAIHRNPLRAAAFVDERWRDALGLSGVTNMIRVVPAFGQEGAVEQQLFRQPSVASIRTVDATSRMYRDAVDRFVGIFRVIEGFVLLLAMLIAFNTASISTDERAREHATLFAFGVPPRSVVRMGIVEGLCIGVLGTGIGLLLGDRILRWLTNNLARRTIPEIGLEITVSSTTLLTAIAIGVVAVAFAPLLTMRRLRRMDVPAALRYVE